MTIAAVMGPIQAQQGATLCKVSGRVASGATGLPGVSIVARAGDTVASATSSETDGTYHLALAPGTYRLEAELTGFTAASRSVTLAEPCEPQALDLQLALAPRTPRAAAAQAAGPAGRGRFETLNVASQQTAALAEVQPPEREAIDAATRLLLPPGFSTEGATESLTVAGNMASIDRGMMGDRFEAIGRGEFDPTTGEFGQGFGPGGRGGPGGPGGGQGGPGGRGGPGGMGPGGGRGDFFIAGRGGRQNAYNVQTNYSYGGSGLNSAPYQLRPDSAAAVRPYSRQTFGVTVGGPVRLPGYRGDRRTTFTASYNGNRGDQLFDQYATVPDEAMRAGDFSSLSTPLIDPSSGLPFAGNQIPAARMDAASLALLRFLPLPNVEGASRNFHYTTTTHSVADNVNVRFTHNFTAPAAGRGGPGGRGGGGRMGGPGGRGGRGVQQGTSVVMNAQVQYRRGDSEQTNVFPTLGGTSNTSGFSAPVSFNIMRRRTMQSITVNYTRNTSGARGRYAFVEDVAGDAGIRGIASDPFAWGVPTLSFSSLTSLRDVTPNERIDNRWTFGYMMSRPWRTSHTLRIGGDVRLDSADSRSDANARGAYTFSGLYSSGGSLAVRGGGLDFADFLLGLPQQASVQYGPGEVRMAGRSMSLYVQDDWRKTSTLTFNLGVRYELMWPFREANGHMVNLDVAPEFTAAAPVPSGGTGPFTGAFPNALLRADTNNVAPRLGFAWRVKPGTILRGGYGISYNAGSYASIARQMIAQPPFAVTDTRLGTATSPLLLQDAFAGDPAAQTTNNYGVDRNYALGVVQTWNADLSRDLRQVWNVGAGYTHTRGSSLDILRAPNRGPDGLRIPDVQPFIWQSSEGESKLNALTLRARRRPARGIGAGVTYTLAKSRDNASTIGGGGSSVAQDDQNLAAEWGLSTFDRRHQVSSDTSLELPFGQNRPWLNNGGMWARLLENWRVSATFTWQSGTPYTPRVLNAASDVARGTSGTLRANYGGEPIRLNDPTIDLFFNTAAFSVPPPGTFGSASRNLIIGPGSRQLDAQLGRDIRLKGTRVLSFNVNASNVLNLVNYSSIDTTVNSPTFGQVLSVRPMRSMQVGLRFRF